MHRLGIEPLGTLGGRQMPVHPLKQPRPVVLLQFLDGPGHRRLGHVELLRRMGGILRLVYRHKDTQMSYGHRKNFLSHKKRMTVISNRYFTPAPLCAMIVPEKM